MGKTVLCPRCTVNRFTPYGEDPATEDAPRPSMSRAADVYICNQCGVHEAFIDMARMPQPLPHEWPVVLPEIEKVLDL